MMAKVSDPLPSVNAPAPLAIVTPARRNEPVLLPESMLTAPVCADARFKVMPGFGAMILDQAMKPGSYNWLTHLLGWTYHFSNGIGFGIMYVAAIGNPLKHHWLWGVMMAVGLEAAMLLMPYASLFAIRVTPQFVTVTLAAHLVFGAVLGLSVRWLAGNLKR